MDDAVEFFAEYDAQGRCHRWENRPSGLVERIGPANEAIATAIREAESAARADENYECSQVAERYGDPEIRDAITDRLAPRGE